MNVGHFRNITVNRNGAKTIQYVIVFFLIILINFFNAIFWALLNDSNTFIIVPKVYTNVRIHVDILRDSLITFSMLVLIDNVLIICRMINCVTKFKVQDRVDMKIGFIIK